MTQTRETPIQFATLAREGLVAAGLKGVALFDHDGEAVIEFEIDDLGRIGAMRFLPGDETTLNEGGVDVIVEVEQMDVSVRLTSLERPMPEVVSASVWGDVEDLAAGAVAVRRIVEAAFPARR